MKKTIIVHGAPRSLRYDTDVSEAHRNAARLEGAVKNKGIKPRKKERKVRDHRKYTYEYTKTF